MKLYFKIKPIQIVFHRETCNQTYNVKVYPWFTIWNMFDWKGVQKCLLKIEFQLKPYV